MAQVGGEMRIVSHGFRPQYMAKAPLDGADRTARGADVQLGLISIKAGFSDVG
ncbi:MAG: hypothetical protein Kow00106_20580 [Anaerolineae bacterium]